jgi:hypothetical protein
MHFLPHVSTFFILIIFQRCLRPDHSLIFSYADFVYRDSKQKIGTISAIKKLEGAKRSGNIPG